MADLKTPFALFGKVAMTARDAAALGYRGTGLFTCPECEEPCHLKAGDVNQAHFAHESDSTCAGGESYQHYTAKQTVVSTLNSYFAGEKQAPGYSEYGPTMRRNCYVDKHKPINMFILTVLLRDYRHSGCVARPEKKITSGHRPDIVIYSGNKAIAAVEVFCTNAVDRHKAAALSQQMPWIEVSAVSVSKGLPWQVLGYGGFKFLHCPQCKKDVEQMHARTQRAEESRKKQQREQQARMRWDAFLLYLQRGDFKSPCGSTCTFEEAEEIEWDILINSRGDGWVPNGGPR